MHLVSSRSFLLDPHSASLAPTGFYISLSQLVRDHHQAAHKWSALLDTPCSWKYYSSSSSMVTTLYPVKFLTTLFTTLPSSLTPHFTTILGSMPIRMEKDR